MDVPENGAVKFRRAILLETPLADSRRYIRRYYRLGGLISPFHMNVTSVTADKTRILQSLGVIKFSPGYGILRSLETGELLLVGTRDDRGEALKLVERLNAVWPAEYIIQELIEEDQGG